MLRNTTCGREAPVSFFPKCQQLVLMSHAKKTKCLFILCYQMTTGLGALGKQGESSSHEKPCWAYPTLGVFPMTPKGALQMWI
jgi:hypothetical protein